MCVHCRPAALDPTLPYRQRIRLQAVLGKSESLARMFRRMVPAAQMEQLNVLLTGPTGSGKSLIAGVLHRNSSRATGPFVAVNCAAISAELVESELFGHEKGAFTGADARRIGRFEAADGGTIFLDEIGDMAPATQAKVLRVLQERSFERVGGTQPIDVDVRVIAATHRDLAADVKSDRFREDLYYRLRVVEIELPPLRERREDIPALAQRFLEQVTERLGREKKPFSEACLARLARHDWPGNVRELHNAIERAAVLAAGAEIEAEDLNLREAESAPDAGASALEGLPFSDAKKRVVEDFERRFLLNALRKSGGNVSRAAESIGMVRQSLQQKIRELGLRSEDWGEGKGHKEEGR